MGGLGKTTVAQMIYNDERTKKRFNLRIWVCVSDNFDVLRLVRAVIESIDRRRCDLSELDSLQQHLRERLVGKKFLLVLDDVWNEKQRLWEEFRAILRCDSKGSAVLVTTRIKNVASMMANTDVCHIGRLTEEDSWSLFRQRAFSTGNVDENLVVIGKKMVGKCGGMPLAIKALGSMMRSKTGEGEWLSIEESDVWCLLENEENGVSLVLKLSYYNLPLHMRQCFAYCCIFPKDYEMQENQLIQLWMANGFIPPFDGQRDLLFNGHLIFKELVFRSFFQDIHEDNKGNRTCKMHDLIHDLATSVMGNEAYIIEHGKVLEIPKGIHHLSFAPGLFFRAPNNKSKIKLPSVESLRSIVVHQTEYRACCEDLSPFLSKQKYLRALDVTDSFMKKLPNLVCKLKHLKYLVMACFDLKTLPESLTRLFNLQTLKLTNSAQLLELPKDLKLMKRLWFLEIENSHSLICTPPGLGDLSCLRRLSIFIVGQDASQHIDQLKELNLEGELTIKGLDHVRTLEDAKSSNLASKRHMSSLSLYWKKDHENKPTPHFDKVIQGLKPHHNLQRLYVYCYHGSKFPNWMGSSNFSNMKEMILEQCQRCEYLPPLGNLPCLNHLELNQMNSVLRLGNEWLGDKECPFPALTTLNISSMSNLEEWSMQSSIKGFPCLTHLGIHECRKLAKFPFLPTLRHLSINGSNEAILTSIRNLISLESFSMRCVNEVNTLPGNLLQHSHAALEHLKIEAPCIRSVWNLLNPLSSLKTLCFTRCFDLEVLPEGLGNLHSLETLKFQYCDNLATFPAIILEGLSSLQSLYLENCKKLQPLSGPLNKPIPSLRCLEIHSLPMLQHLPESIRQLSALRQLSVWSCDGLLSLPDWFGQLESLSELLVWDCNNIYPVMACKSHVMEEAWLDKLIRIGQKLHPQLEGKQSF